MRERILKIADSLELVFLNPIQFVGDWEKDERDWLAMGRWLAFFSANSISTGCILVSPPYNKGFIVGLALSTLANFLVLLVLPYFLGSFLDYLSQTRERKGNAKMMVAYTSIVLSLNILFVPLAYLCLVLGLTGLGGAFLLLLILFLGIGIVLSKGVKFIYDLKDSDSLRYSFLALGLSFIYPFLFNFYMTTGILNLTL